MILKIVLLNYYSHFGFIGYITLLWSYIKNESSKLEFQQTTEEARKEASLVENI